VRLSISSLALTLAACFVLASTPATRCEAASAEAEALFAEATAAFDAREYSRARALFEQALAAGMDGPAIHYNIGAAAYRAGDLPRAERAFREVARTPSMAAIANYNLGLVALDRRDEREAREWFESATRDTAANHRIVELASRRLEELPQPTAAGRWSYYARAGAGQDDNIALRSDTIASSATGDADSFGELVVAGSYSVGGWRIDGGASMLEYQELDDFSQSSLYLGGARGFRLDKWYLELGALGSQSSFGGEVYERTTSAGALLTRLFYGGSRLRAQVRAGAVDGQGLFAGLTGNRQELGVYYDRGWRAWYFGAHARAERNSSDDPIFATRWVQLGAETRYTASPYWGFMLGAAARRTSRPAISGDIAGWDDDRLSLQAGVMRTLWKQAQLYLRYEHEANGSPVPGFDYERNRASASVEFWY
jgi:Tfp pilus assembly protein PilF